MKTLWMLSVLMLGLMLNARTFAETPAVDINQPQVGLHAPISMPTTTGSPSIKYQGDVYNPNAPKVGPCQPGQGAGSFGGAGGLGLTSAGGVY